MIKQTPLFQAQRKGCKKEGSPYTDFFGQGYLMVAPMARGDSESPLTNLSPMVTKWLSTDVLCEIVIFASPHSRHDKRLNCEFSPNMSGASHLGGCCPGSSPITQDALSSPSPPTMRSDQTWFQWRGCLVRGILPARERSAE